MHRLCEQLAIMACALEEQLPDVSKSDERGNDTKLEATGLQDATATEGADTAASGSLEDRSGCHHA